MTTEDGIRVQLIGKPGLGMTGTSRYTTELHQGLQAAGVDARLTFPAPAPIPGSAQAGLLHFGLDVQAFFASYPLRVSLDGSDIYHVTTQTMATLLLSQRFPRPVVVTVLDIIPYQVRHDRNLNTSRHFVDCLFYRLALAGLRRSNAVIAISQYTKKTLIDVLGLPAELIYVVPLAVDHERFRPIQVSDAFRTKYGLETGCCYILYVGSDNPRKNLGTLIHAFAQVAWRQPDVRLLKVGAEKVTSERERLHSLVAQFGLQKQVVFLESVPEEDLPLLYNAADVFVLPSLYEGFGLPVLEAMACGTPVVCSDVASLPEVAGDAALLASPRSVEGLAEAMMTLLRDKTLWQSQHRKGLARAAQFAWRRVAEETTRVYSAILAEPSYVPHGSRQAIRS